LSKSDPGFRSAWHRLTHRLASAMMEANQNRPLHPGDRLVVPDPSALSNDQTTPLQPASPRPTPIASPSPIPVSPPRSVYAPFEVAPGAAVNGRLGFHWRNDLADGDMARAQRIIDEAKKLGAGYCTLLASIDNPNGNAALIRKLQENGVTPVVRLYLGTTPQGWSDHDLQKIADCARQVSSLGVKLIHIGNEPNIEGHFDGLSREDYLERSTARQAEALLAVRRAVGADVKIGIPPMAPGSPDSGTAFAPQTYFPALLNKIKRLEVATGERLCDWIPTHTYTFGEPGTQGEAQMGRTARGQLGWGPATGTWYEAQAQSILGYSARSLSTEGGAEPSAFRSDSNLVTGQMNEAMEQLRKNSGLTNCLWLLYDDEGMQNGQWGSWNRMALESGEGLWGDGLSLYRSFRDRGGE
jgi:hypothetical protein